MIEMLNILEGYDLAAAGHNSPRYIHLVVEAQRRAFLDRARYLGDPDFTALPVNRLTSKAYAAELRKTILDDRASISTPLQVADRYESKETTHYSVVDGSGMAVSVTYTLENGYGLGAVVPGVPEPVLPAPLPAEAPLPAGVAPGVAVGVEGICESWSE